MVSPQSSGAVWQSRQASWAPRPNSVYGVSGRKATVKKKNGGAGIAELRSCVKIEVDVLGPQSLNSPYGLCGRKATCSLNLNQESVARNSLWLSAGPGNQWITDLIGAPWFGDNPVVERRTRDRKVSDSNPGRCSGRIFSLYG